MVHSYDRKDIVFNGQWATRWNIHYSITAITFYLYHQVPVRDRWSSTNHKLLSRMAARHFIVYMRRFIHIYGYLQVYSTSGKQYDQAAVKYFRHGQSWWLTGSVALKGNRSLKSPALHSVRRVAVSLTVNPSCKALSTVYVCACVCSWWDFILSSSGAEIWEPVGEQCCWESFRGAVQDPLGDNRHWEAGDCLDCPKLHFVGPSRKMLSSLVTAPGKWQK